MSNELLVLSVVDRVATITFNNPPVNLLSTRVLVELGRLVDRLATDSSIKVMVITSSGRFFCPGADLKELQHIDTAQQAKDVSLRGQALLNRIEQLDKPVLAAINGSCLGGGIELALACHLRFASPASSFGLPEVNLGLIPGWGGTQRLPKLIGLSKATEILLTGSLISAEEAQRCGLVNAVWSEADLLPRTQEFAARLAQKGRLALRAVLRALRAAQDNPLAEGLAQEAELFGELFETKDAKEGINAFLEKRQPNFQDQ